MMRINLISALFFLLFCVGCNENKPVEKQFTVPKKKSVLKFNTENLDTLSGIYMGDFGGSDIRIILTHVSRNHIVGYNIFKGLRRNLSGNYFLHGDTVEMTLHEPGDNEFDGIFEIEIYRSTFTGKGKWESNSGKISAKYFKLEKLPAIDDDIDIKKLNNANFASYYSWAEDSLGTIQFEDDGSCIYSYYPNYDEKKRVEQIVEFQGSWVYKNNFVKINWQQNPVFPSRILELKLNSEDHSLDSKSTGRKFYIAEYRN